MIKHLMEQLDYSSCNYMAVDCIKRELEANGFENLDLSSRVELKTGHKYYAVRNDSAIMAFITGTADAGDAGFRIISAHSDSPCFKLKPMPEIYGDGGVVSLNVEKYGGGIMYTWFDRPLSISGRVAIRTDNPLRPEMRLIDLRRPVATIPHLAIHFNRAVNEGNPLSVQKDMKPVLGIYDKSEFEKMRSRGGVVKCMIAEECGVEPEDILSTELVLYPYANAVLSGVHNELLQSARIDDLSMAFTGLAALLRSAAVKPETPYTRILAIFDNEETGSGTRQGAAAPTLRNLLHRVAGSDESFYRALERTFMISADDAHAWHPNYNEKYDPTNHPVINGGPVIKINANCKYMTDSRGAAVFAGLCDKAGVAY
ncbi:MAG: M18 family aminopeptidase, partial [Muribaculaceae bacterium]|nr:M18 family aminopeptidase [Muribaculaceae bacterium]